MSVSVMLADDQPLLRRGVFPGLRLLVGAAGVELVALARRHAVAS